MQELTDRATEYEVIEQQKRELRASTEEHRRRPMLVSVTYNWEECC